MLNSDPKAWPCRHADGNKMYMDHFEHSRKYRFQARINNYWYVTWVSDDWTPNDARTQAQIDFMFILAGKDSMATMLDNIPDYGPLP